MLLLKQGVVKLLFRDSIISVVINEYGEATFNKLEEIPFASSAKVKLWYENPDGEKYETIGPASDFHLTQRGLFQLKVVKPEVIAKQVKFAEKPERKPTRMLKKETWIDSKKETKAKLEQKILALEMKINKLEEERFSGKVEISRFIDLFASYQVELQRLRNELNSPSRNGLNRSNNKH